MTRRLYVYRNGKFIEADECVSQSHHHVIVDSMNATQHPCDGKYYDSKSAFRRVTKAHGCVELGNDKIPRRKASYDDLEASKTVRADISKTLGEYGY